MLKEVPFANALAVAIGGLYLVCAFLVVTTPDLFKSLAQSWIHSYDLSGLSSAQITVGGFWLGLVTAVLAAWLFGYLLAWVYNKLNK